MEFTGLAYQDPSKTSLPWQILGAGLLAVGVVMLRAASGGWHLDVAWWWVTLSGVITHVFGDAWFFFQLKARKAI